LQCFDQQFHISHAKEHWDQIVAKILRPATTEIQNQFIRAWALEYSGKRYCACAGLPEFDYGLQADANGDYTILCTSQRPTSLLTPGMLQYAYGPLLLDGYFGESPFQGKTNLPLAALVTDLDTCWLLQHLNHDAGVGGTPSIADNWRFTQWDAANEYWRYGLSGQIGNFAVEVDALAPRFNYMDQNGPADTPYRFQAVAPYLPGAATHGIKNIPNPDYQTAQVRGTFIWHKSALQLQTAETTTINPEMPFLKRNQAGKWWFAMHDLGADCNGRAIDNTRLNKGIWKADFQQGVRPRHTEWTRFFLHLSQPPAITIIPPTVTSEGYPEQDYNCACEDCGNCR